MKTYGLIGFPLGHSFSRDFFTKKFRRENKKEQYLNFEIPKIEELPLIVESNPFLAGLNVTIPYKQKVIPYLTRTDSVAEEIGAVNTIRITRTAGLTSLEGFNTDFYGFSESLRPLLKTWHHSALILGTGGASGAVVFALDRMGIHWLQVSRNPGRKKCIAYSEINRQILQEYSVVVNTTPVGTYPDTDSCPDIPYHLLTERHLLYDLIYNPAETRFLSLGSKNGAFTKNGYEMLELQALKSYEIWNL